jgi:hypothetical protein
MGIDVDVPEPPGVEGGGAPYEAVNLVPLGEKKFDQVRAVLAGDAGYERLGHGVLRSSRDVPVIGSFAF